MATSAPTGTDDDMGGNDKLTPSLEQTLDRTGTRGAQHNFFPNPVGPY